MSTEDNKALMRRFYEEVFNKGNLDAIDELGSPDMVDHNPSPGTEPGPEGVKKEFAMMRSAFPDLNVNVEDMVAEGDKVVSRVTMRGTHKGDFMGIPASGKQITVTGMDIVRFSGGKAVERWGQFDDLGMMQQLGVVPPPE